MDKADDNVLRFEHRRLERRLPGVGPCVFVAPGARAEIELACRYDEPDPDHRAFVNELIAAAIEDPRVDAARADLLSERARAIARVAATEVAGCASRYRALSGSGLSGDERLFTAVRERYQERVARLAETGAAVTEKVVRMADQARETLLKSGALDYFERNRRQLEHLQRAIRPDQLDRLERLRRQSEFVLRPAVLDQVEHLRKEMVDGGVLGEIERQRSPVESVFSGYTKLTETLGRQFEGLMRPSYFGSLERLSRQLDGLVRPRHRNALVAQMERLREVVRPRQLDAIAKALRPAKDGPVAEVMTSLRQSIASAVESYAAWLERNWADTYADPDHPPPVMFLIASLPMAVGLPLLAAVKTDDETLLTRLEAALSDGPLLDQLQAAVQATPELDAIAKRNLVQALEWVRRRHYVDATAPLCHGLERAFTGVARRRAIIDSRNHFRISARTRKATKVEDLFEHLALDPAYLRFLRSWVFGEIGNDARHGNLPDELAHRRWVLRAVAALFGWFDYCAGEASLMDELVERLELPPGTDDETAADV